MDFDKLKKQIQDFHPDGMQEIKDTEVFLKYINDFGDQLLTRENEYGHITSSGWIVNKERTHVLFIFHNIYNSWSWTGGHADGDADLLAVAMREAEEETGVTTKPISKEIFALDILPVPGHVKRGKWVSAHQHLSICYLLEADDKDPLRIKEDENSGVKWIPVEKVLEYSTEPDMHPVYTKLMAKVKNGNY